MKRFLLKLSIVIISLLTFFHFSKLFVLKSKLTEKEAEFKCKFDSIDLVNKDFDLINVRLRGLISKSSNLENELTKDTAYLNIASKYN